MKNFKFSRLFAAVLFVAVLGLTSCVQPSSLVPGDIEGTWTSAYDEKYVITDESIKEAAWDTWAIEIEDSTEISDNSGIIYGKLTKGSSYTPEGEYYAVAYKALTETSVQLSSAAVSYKTLEEVMKNYSKLDDFAYYSECAKAAE